MNTSQIINTKSALEDLCHPLGKLSFIGSMIMSAHGTTSEESFAGVSSADAYNLGALIRDTIDDIERIIDDVIQHEVKKNLKKLDDQHLKAL